MNWKRLLRRSAQASRPRLTRAHLLAALLLGLLGFSLVAQARQTQSESLSALNQSELVKILDTVTNQSDAWMRRPVTCSRPARTTVRQ